ncbi:MAG: beta-ketoacyl synthase chain length factor [Gammaproteobacteria bacterium]|nr:beta-ketoacyl synthase chain length factor [Gammaproteobacteria bacterium]
MKLLITGIGLWSATAANWQEFLEPTIDSESAIRKLPANDLVPAAERRRMPKTAKLAIEVATQACSMADIDIQTITSVFTSQIADTEITDYLCRALAAPVKSMSPTKFHNSVQNAPGGYWAIGAKNHMPCNYVSGFRECWQTGLLEAAIQCVTEDRPVLLANYDLACKPPLADVFPATEDFACALVLETATSNKAGIEIEIRIANGDVTAPEATQKCNKLRIEHNPSARTLVQLEAFTTSDTASLQWPLTQACHLQLLSQGKLPMSGI